MVHANHAVGAAPSPRIAVVLDEADGLAVTGALEARLQEEGCTVVAAEVSRQIRNTIAPQELLHARFPEGLAVFEADAILAGTADFGPPTDIDGVQSIPVALTVRLINLATGEATATLQSSGVGIGVGGPTIAARAARQAVGLLFDRHGLARALHAVGQSAGSVVLIVQDVPHRRAWLELEEALRAALAGAPVREIYFARGLGKFVLGGSRSERAMTGPDIANLLGVQRALALRVEEVANTRILAQYDRSRTVRIHALVVETRLPRRSRRRVSQLGKFVATKLASFDFARASYQRGHLSRKAALRRAKEIGADVIVESEVLGRGKSAALALRVIHVDSGRPIHREQQVLGKSDSDFSAANALVATLETVLPEKLGTTKPVRVIAAEAIPTAEINRKQGTER